MEQDKKIEAIRYGLMNPYFYEFSTTIRNLISTCGIYTDIIFKQLANILDSLLNNPDYFELHVKSDDNNGNLYNNYIVTNPNKTVVFPKKYSHKKGSNKRVYEALIKIKGERTNEELATEFDISPKIIRTFFDESHGEDLSVKQDFLTKLAIRCQCTIPYLLGYTDEPHCLCNTITQRLSTDNKKDSVSPPELNAVSFPNLPQVVDQITAYLNKSRNEDAINLLLFYSSSLDDGSRDEFLKLTIHIISFYKSMLGLPTSPQPESK